MGALSPHPTMGRCMKTCTPSRMRKKFLARIKKNQEKAILSARKAPRWVPKPESAEKISAASCNSPEKQKKSVGASRQGPPKSKKNPGASPGWVGEAPKSARDRTPLQRVVHIPHMTGPPC